jgi:enamine deaminase RidA (YjgF/YER057c/UK114 family)
MKGRFSVAACVAASALTLLSQAVPAFSQSNASTPAAVPRGMDTGDYVYVSGQGPGRADGTIPDKFSDQVRQALDNVKSVVEAAGLTINHVVYVQVYLGDIRQSTDLDEVFASYFPKDPPARAVLGVAKLPQPGVQITAIAVRDLSGKRPVFVPNFPQGKAYSYGMLTHDQLFVSTMPGRDPITGTVPQDPALQVNLALDGVKSVVEAAGLTMAHMVFVNPYLTAEISYGAMNEQYAKRFEFGNTPGRATIEVSSLPLGAHIAYTGVAVRDLSRRLAVRPKNMAPSPTASPCVFAGDILYCSAKSGFIPGPNGGIYAESITDQTRQTMRNLLDNLEEAGMSFDQVVYTTIYLDDLSDGDLFSQVYRKYFSAALPGQTTLQQLPPGDRKANQEGHFPTLEQMSLIAVRTGKEAKPRRLP